MAVITFSPDQIDTFWGFLEKKHFDSTIGTVDAYYNSLLQIINIIGEKPFQDVTADEIHVCKVTMLKGGFKRGTINRYLMAIKTVWKWMYEEILNQNGLPKKFRDNFKKLEDDTEIKKEDLLTEDEVFSIVYSCKKFRDQALVALMYETMSRREEIMILNVGDVIRSKKGYAFIKKKIKKMRKTDYKIHEIPIHYSRLFLENWLRIHPSHDDPESPLFVTKWKGKWKRIGYDQIGKIVIHAAKRAGIKKRVWPHLLIHSAISIWRTRKMHDKQVQYIRGWKNLQMLSRYDHITSDMPERVAETLIPGYKGETTQENLPIICPKCKAVNHQSADFCQACALPFNAPYIPLTETEKQLEEKLKTKSEEIDKLKSELNIMAQMMENIFQKVNKLEAKNNISS